MQKQKVPVIFRGRPMAEQLIAFYGLKEPPFSLSPAPRFLFISDQHRSCMAKIRYMVEYRRGLSIVFGDVGTGKTTVARRIFDLLASPKNRRNFVR
jgi:type II secretory pathway predicted ATPase ExeA